MRSCWNALFTYIIGNSIIDRCSSVGICGSKSGCPILPPSQDILGVWRQWNSWGTLWFFLFRKICGPACWVRSSYLKTPSPWSLSEKFIREVAHCSILCWESCKNKHRMCSGATLYTWLEKDGEVFAWGRNSLRSFSLLSACAKARRAQSRYTRCSFIMVS